MAIETFVAIVSACIAFGSAGISAYYSRRAIKAQDRAHEIEIAGWKQQYLSELRSWAGECCDELSNAFHLCGLNPMRTTNPVFADHQHAARIKLSSLIDRGRWFFPNDNSSEYGDHKEAAYRGFRDPILDSLVATYDLLGVMSHEDQSKNIVLQQTIDLRRREFVSHIQETLDPLDSKADFIRFVERMAEHRKYSTFN